MSEYVIYNGSLYHYGTKGQKWGVRRFQNPDGSLTEEGRRRYGVLEKKIAKQEAKIAKWQKKVDSKSGKYLRAVKKQNKAARLRNKAYNGFLISNSKRAKLAMKADRLDAKAAKMMNSTLKNEAKIRRAQAKIAKYNRKMSKINPNHVATGQAYINSLTRRGR